MAQENIDLLISSPQKRKEYKDKIEAFRKKIVTNYFNKKKHDFRGTLVENRKKFEEFIGDLSRGKMESINVILSIYKDGELKKDTLPDKLKFYFSSRGIGDGMTEAFKDFAKEMNNLFLTEALTDIKEITSKDSKEISDLKKTIECLFVAKKEENNMPLQVKAFVDSTAQAGNAYLKFLQLEAQDYFTILKEKFPENKIHLRLIGDNHENIMHGIHQDLEISLKHGKLKGLNIKADEESLIECFKNKNTEEVTETSTYSSNSSLHHNKRSSAFLDAFKKHKKTSGNEYSDKKEKKVVRDDRNEPVKPEGPDNNISNSPENTLPENVKKQTISTVNSEAFKKAYAKNRADINKLKNKVEAILYSPTLSSQSEILPTCDMWEKFKQTKGTEALAVLLGKESFKKAIIFIAKDKLKYTPEQINEMTALFEKIESAMSKINGRPNTTTISATDTTTTSPTDEHTSNTFGENTSESDNSPLDDKQDEPLNTSQGNTEEETDTTPTAKKMTGVPSGEFPGDDPNDIKLLQTLFGSPLGTNESGEDNRFREKFLSITGSKKSPDGNPTAGENSNQNKENTPSRGSARFTTVYNDLLSEMTVYNKELTKEDQKAVELARYSSVASQVLDDEDTPFYSKTAAQPPKKEIKVQVKMNATEPRVVINPNIQHPKEGDTTTYAPGSAPVQPGEPLPRNYSQFTTAQTTSFFGNFGNLTSSTTITTSTTTATITSSTSSHNSSGFWSPDKNASSVSRGNKKNPAQPETQEIPNPTNLDKQPIDALIEKINDIFRSAAKEIEKKPQYTEAYFSAQTTWNLYNIDKKIPDAARDEGFKNKIIEIATHLCGYDTTLIGAVNAYFHAVNKPASNLGPKA